VNVTVLLQLTWKGYVYRTYLFLKNKIKKNMGIDLSRSTTKLHISLFPLSGPVVVEFQFALERTGHLALFIPSLLVVDFSFQK